MPTGTLGNDLHVYTSFKVLESVNGGNFEFSEDPRCHRSSVDSLIFVKVKQRSYQQGVADSLHCSSFVPNCTRVHDRLSVWWLAFVGDFCQTGCIGSRGQCCQQCQCSAPTSRGRSVLLSQLTSFEPHPLPEPVPASPLGLRTFFSHPCFPCFPSCYHGCKLRASTSNSNPSFSLTRHPN